MTCSHTCVFQFLKKHCLCDTVLGNIFTFLMTRHIVWMWATHLLSRFSRGVSSWWVPFGCSLLTITFVCGTTLNENFQPHWWTGTYTHALQLVFRECGSASFCNGTENDHFLLYNYYTQNINQTAFDCTLSLKGDYCGQHFYLTIALCSKFEWPPEETLRP